MRNDKDAALKLRLNGKSYSEICSALGIPKSTLSGWFSDVVLSETAQKRITERSQKKSLDGLIKRNKNQTKLAWERARQIQNSASKEIDSLSKTDLLIVAAALYWAEGYKKLLVRKGKEVTHHPVSLTNSDPVLIKMFLRFLREYCKVPEEKIRADLRIFPNQNGKYIQEFWEKETGILPCNFGKIYTGISKSSQSKRPYNRLPIGVIQIRVSDTKLFHRIIGYIEGLKKFV